MNGFMASTSKL